MGRDSGLSSRLAARSLLLIAVTSALASGSRSAQECSNSATSLCASLL